MFFCKSPNDYAEGFLCKVDLKSRELFRLENPFAGNDIPTNQVACWLDPMKRSRPVFRFSGGRFRLFWSVSLPFGSGAFFLRKWGRA